MCSSDLRRIKICFVVVVVVRVYSNGCSFGHVNGELVVAINGSWIASYNDMNIGGGYSNGNYVSHSFNHFSFISVADSGSLEISSYSGGVLQLSNSIGYYSYKPQIDSISPMVCVGDTVTVYCFFFSDIFWLRVFF